MENAPTTCVGLLEIKYAQYHEQEAMENFVFPDKIKTKLMKMSQLMNIFMSH